MKIKLTELNVDNPRIFDVSWVRFIGSYQASGGFLWASDIHGNPGLGAYHLQSDDLVLNTDIRITSISSDNQSEFVCS